MAATEVTRPYLVEVQGSLAAADTTELGFQLAGRIAQIAVDLGDRVAAGAELATLDRTDFELEVRRAEAGLQQARVRLGLPAAGDDDTVDPEATATVRGALAVLAEAKINLDRARGMAAQDLSSRAAVDAAVAAHAVADSRVQEAREEAHNRQAVLAQRRVELAIARRRLAETALRAPFAGAVVARRAAPGHFVSVGDIVVALERTAVLRLRLKVPERDAAQVRIDQTVAFKIEGDSVEQHGRIARMSPSLTTADRTLTIEADVDNALGKLRPGVFVRAQIVTDRSEKLARVPAAAVSRLAGVHRVLTVRDGKAEHALVEVLPGAPQGQLDLRGLEPGTEVIADATGLASGALVAPER